MLSKKTLIILLTINIFAITNCFAQTATGKIEENWNDFLHYMRIGSLDMAKSCAKAILTSNPEPVAMFTISSKNEQGMSILLKAKYSSKGWPIAFLIKAIPVYIIRLLWSSGQFNASR